MLSPEGRAAIVEAICTQIAAVIERWGTMAAPDLTMFEPAGAAFVEACAPAILKHLLPVMHATGSGGLASRIIAAEDGDMQLFAEADLGSWRLERCAGGIEAAGASPLSLLEFFLPEDRPAAWLQVIGLATVLTLEPSTSINSKGDGA